MRALCLHETRQVAPRGSELCEPSSSSSTPIPHRTHRTAQLQHSVVRQQAMVARSAASTPVPAMPSTATEVQVGSWLLDRPIFNPNKLAVTYLPGAQTWVGPFPMQRRYTLTHNDLTGALQLSVGSQYNHRQLSNWYLRLLRDEILAEWDFAGIVPTLHVYCHVSGQELWLATPGLRKFIFEKEMPLVLKTIRHGDHNLMSQVPNLCESRVIVHFQSHLPELNCSQDWGILGNEKSWPAQGAPPWLLPLQFMFDRVVLQQFLRLR